MLSLLTFMVGCTSSPTESDAVTAPIVQAREQARVELSAQLDELLTIPTLEEAGGSWSVDTCYEDDVRTTVRFRCAMALTAFAIPTTEPDGQLTDLESAIKGLEWQGSGQLNHDFSDPSETSCWGATYTKPDIMLTVAVTTTGRGGAECWDRSRLDRYTTSDNFWEQQSKDTPTWEQLGSPDVAVSITVATIYHWDPDE